jgi:enoyl-CoA hydratase/carnithine racemase
MFSREDTGSVAVLRLAHGKVSALDDEFCAALMTEIADIAAESPKAMVITGTGTAFSAGVDLFRVIDGGAEYLLRFLPLMRDFFHALLTFPKPAVAAINGHAIAGGCIIAAACDHRIMANGTGRIGVPELAVGVPFPTLPFEIVGARVQPSVFRQLVYSGRTVLPHEAVTLGLVDETVDPETLLDRARERAEQLMKIPAKTFALTKRTFAAALLDRVQAASALNADVLETWASPEVQNRIRQYVDETVGSRKAKGER